MQTKTLPLNESRILGFLVFWKKQKLSVHPGGKALLLLLAQEGRGGGPGSAWLLHAGVRPCWVQHVLKMRLVLLRATPDEDPGPVEEVLAVFHRVVEVVLPWNLEASESKLQFPPALPTHRDHSQPDVPAPHKGAHRIWFKMESSSKIYSIQGRNLAPR